MALPDSTGSHRRPARRWPRRLRLPQPATAILLSDDKLEPELMYRMVDKLAVSLDELLDWTGEAVSS